MAFQGKLVCPAHRYRVMCTDNVRFAPFVVVVCKVIVESALHLDVSVLLAYLPQALGGKYPASALPAGVT